MAGLREVPTDDGRSGDDAVGLALELVGSNKVVLAVGGAAGSLTERLAGRGCTVSVVDVDDGEWQGATDESFDVVLLADALAGCPDPEGVLRAAARKVKPSGVLVAWLPNAAHGDSRIEGSRIGQFTLEAIHRLFGQAGLVIVDTARVIVPLVEPQFGVTRDEAGPDRLHDLMDDHEVETYEFVVRAVRDNGDRAVAELARRVDELAERARDETVRTAVRRAELWQKDLLSLDLEQHRQLVREQQRAIEEQREYIEALRGHVEGLEHNVEALTQSLEALRRATGATDASKGDTLGRRISRRLTRKRSTS